MNGKTVTRSQQVLLVAQVLRLAVSLVTVVVLGRFLSPLDFGFFALLSAIFILSQEVLDMGTTATATRDVLHGGRSEAEILATLLAWRRIVVLVLMLAGMAFLALGQGYSHLYEGVLAIALLALLLLPLNVYYVVFQVRQSFARIVGVGLAAQGLFLLLAAAMAGWAGAGVLIGLLVVARELGVLLVNRRIAVGMLGSPVTSPVAWPQVREFVSKAWALGLATVAYHLAFHSGTFFLAILADGEELGVFSASQRLFVPLVSSVWVVLTPLIAALSLSASQDEALFRHQVASYFKLLAGVAALTVSAGYLCAPYLLPLLYGETYGTGALSSVGVFRWLTVGFGLSLITPVLVIHAIATHDERRLAGTAVVLLVANILINAWAVPRFGAEGAALAPALTEMVLLGLLLRHALGRQWLETLGGTVPYLLPAVVLALAMTPLPEIPWLQITVAGAMGLASVVILWNLPEQRGCRQTLLTRSDRAAAPAHGLPPRRDDP